MGEIPLSELARRCATEFSTKELCRLTDAQHQEYLRLLSALKTLNASHASDTKKGAILEELVSYLLKISGNIFNVYRTTLIISKKPGNTGISRDIRTEFTTDLLLSD